MDVSILRPRIYYHIFQGPVAAPGHLQAAVQSSAAAGKFPFLAQDTPSEWRFRYVLGFQAHHVTVYRCTLWQKHCHLQPLDRQNVYRRDLRMPMALHVATLLYATSAHLTYHSVSLI